jgi:hypothetical protein
MKGIPIDAIRKLANIFMWKWEKELYQRQLVSNEIYRW